MARTTAPTPTPETITLDWCLTWWEQAEADRYLPDGTPVSLTWAPICAEWRAEDPTSGRYAYGTTRASALRNLAAKVGA